MTGALNGKRVAITRAGEQAKRFAAALLERGARPILAPTISFEPPDDPSASRSALDAIESFDWIVFTSGNGVDVFFERLRERKADARAIAGSQIAAIGEGTAQRLRSHGVRPAVTAKTFIGEGVASSLIERARPNDRVLIYRAQEARDVLPVMLQAAGLRVTVAAAYKTVVPSDPQFGEKIASAEILTFTSASTVRGFAVLLGGTAAAAQAARGKSVACIGPVTAEAASGAGLHVDVVAERYTTDGLLDALATYLGRDSCS